MADLSDAGGIKSAAIDGAQCALRYLAHGPPPRGALEGGTMLFSRSGLQGWAAM